ncbi:hypothetical protein MKS83_08755 [Chryseobacterium sp. Y16C]|uniref:GH39 family glycosyl hydrolase n=1 Tax=Chryseobacterium sp. Y16C TaxID=2920939 RepID=UPI001F0B9722|nr:hypothetical protein [Chryseobacterium sp. Y16C]UMQ43780.1 hypothetical protein MKS83_08755 [Chryseobacterium sp. Y16C]
MIFTIISVFIFCMMNSQRIKDSVSVDIDFNKKSLHVKSMSGFLHYDDIRALQNNIMALQPKYWRIGWSYKSISDINYLRSFNITPILVLSDIYAYPGKKNNKEWSHPLYTDRLKNIVTAEYQKFKNTVIYDIWNEPFHQEGFGDFDTDEYYQIFKKAHDIIRSLPGGDKALITGPSFDRYDEKEIEGFLNFCNKNNIRVDVLSWHEWRDQDYLKNFAKDVKKLKEVILPKYPKVGIKKIVLGEIINQYSQFSGSEILEVFRYLENNGIDGACKGCWAESNGVFNCNNSMNGLLDKNGNPRSVWWAYKLYGQSIKNRVKYISNYEYVSAFASYDNKGQYVIINNNSGNKVINTKINLKNLFQFYKNGKTLELKVYEVPNTNESVLESMILIQKQKISIGKNMIALKIPSMTPKTVYYLTVSNNFK